LNFNSYSLKFNQEFAISIFEQSSICRKENTNISHVLYFLLQEEMAMIFTVVFIDDWGMKFNGVMLTFKEVFYAPNMKYGTSGCMCGEWRRCCIETIENLEKVVFIIFPIDFFKFNWKKQFFPLKLKKKIGKN